jgi:site-specific DNA-methyltransferase (adenine-specific)
VSIDDLADWYAPHVARVSALLAPSASVYLWNTAEGWSRLDPVMRAAGWTFRALVTWDKGIASLAGKGVEALTGWPDVTEVAGFYQREPSEVDLWNRRGDAHPVRRYLDEARERAGLTNAQVDDAIGVRGMARHWFSWTQWCLPSPERYAQLQRLLPGLDRELGDLRAEHADIWARHRSEWEQIRAPFAPPMATTNVWAELPVAGPERLRLADGSPLHQCQKPLLFAERMIRASTRPGERVLVPFGGTCREAVICEWLARTTPADARGYDVCELNADGVDYIGPVLAQIRGEDMRPRAAGQVRLFGGS